MFSKKNLATKLFTGIAVLFLTTNTYAQTWSSDKSHSKLGFSVSHLMLSDVDGNFKNFNLKVTAPKDGFQDAVVELTANVNTINTEDETRDKHLQGADFFDAEKYPTLTFKSKSFKLNKKKKGLIVGDLTIRGVTKTITLTVTYNGSGIHPYSKKTVAGFKVKGAFKRSDFGIGTGTPNAVVGDDITLDANIEIAKD